MQFLIPCPVQDQMEQQFSKCPFPKFWSTFGGCPFSQTFREFSVHWRLIRHPGAKLGVVYKYSVSLTSPQAVYDNNEENIASPIDQSPDEAKTKKKKINTLNVPKSL